MTTAAPSAAPHTSWVRYLSLAVGASLVQMAMMIPGYSDAGSFQTMEWLTALAISLAVGLLVFAFAVPRAGAVTGIVLGVVTVLSTLVFWAGVTLPLAAAATVGVVALAAIIIGDAMAS